MKKKVISVLLCASMIATMAAGCGSKAEDSTADNSTNEPATEAPAETGEDESGSSEDLVANLVAMTEGTVNLTFWCSETDAYQTVMKEIVENFKAEYPDVDFNITVGSCSEADAKDEVTKDVEAAADVYVFADDQLSELVAAGALQTVDTTFTYDVSAESGESSVAAASKDGSLYAYPMTASNGYFLYYNSDIISDVSSWDAILEQANEAGVKVGMNVADGWYIYSFFAGAGLEMTKNDDGTNTCNWNATDTTPTGAQVAEGIEAITKDPAFVSMADEDAMTAVKEGTLAAYVSGTWDSTTVEAAYGDGYAAAKLPTFTVDGEQVQMGSYAGFKLVGVNPLSANNKESETNLFWSMVFAEYVTNATSQGMIAEATGEGPSNTTAAEGISSPALAALSEQSAYADLQVVGDAYWDPAKALGASLVEGADDVQALLDTAVEGITQ